MEALLIFGTVLTAMGLGAVAVGITRSVVLRRTDGTALEAILDDSVDLHHAELSRPFIERLLGPASGGLERAVRAVTPAWWLERIRTNASLAGLGRWGSESVLAIKGVMAAAMGAAFLAGSGAAGVDAGGLVSWTVVGALLGFFVPDFLIARRASTRQDDIRRMLPEALDLLAIAVSAGMGLEQAIELVARRLPGALGEELHRMLQEVQLGASRREALGHLRGRTEVSELSTFAMALAQADALGSPLADVLRVQAGQMRMMRRQRAREQAAKVPVKLLFPLLVCVFPALGIVVVGPAVISIVRAFGG